MLKQVQSLQLAVIIIGVPVGMFLSNRSVEMHEALEHPMAIQHTSMDHGLIDVSSDDIVPQIIDLSVEKDKMSGYNINITTKDFRFAPANVNASHIPGQGHAHLYVNGEKFARLYGPDFHLPPLAVPITTIRVTLNANGHETMSVREEIIEAEWRK